MKRPLLIIFALALVGRVGLVLTQEQAATVPPLVKLDIVLVLDNSGSMKKNDPEFLTKRVVGGFLDGLAPDTRIGLVIFAEKAALILPLTEINEADTKQKTMAGLEQVDYNGQLTNSPAAIERAFYELKQNGRQDAAKLIIFLTDGIVDTGDKQQDRDQERWLRENLAQDCRANGVRIFGIAFTEGADYQLIQALSQTTGGDYYRAFNAGEIESVFQHINTAISQPRPTPTNQPPPPAPDSGVWWLLPALVGVIILGALAVLVIIRRGPQPGPPAAISHADASIPGAVLQGLGTQETTTYRLTKRVTKIGRAEPNQTALDIPLNEPTVSALHAVIEYRDENFYLTDQRSANGTFVNGHRITNERLLQTGDEIRFDCCQFRFTLPETAARGGTMLRVPESPVAPAPPVVAQDSEIKTAFKEEMCPNHPSFRATELCPVCKKGYCEACMTEQAGRQVCQQCARI